MNLAVADSLIGLGKGLNSIQSAPCSHRFNGQALTDSVITDNLTGPSLIEYDGLVHKGEEKGYLFDKANLNY